MAQEIGVSLIVGGKRRGLAQGDLFGSEPRRAVAGGGSIPEIWIRQRQLLSAPVLCT
jgi:hypothetical protein